LGRVMLLKTFSTEITHPLHLRSRHPALITAQFPPGVRRV
jgi:hypothetical protein